MMLSEQCRAGRPPKSGCFKISVTQCHNREVRCCHNSGKHVACVSIERSLNLRQVPPSATNCHNFVTVNHCIDISPPISGQMPHKLGGLFQAIQMAYQKYLRFVANLFGAAVSCSPHVTRRSLWRRSLPHLLPKEFFRHLWEKYLFIDLIFRRGQHWPMCL
jgi:hypothetical protein